MSVETTKHLKAECVRAIKGLALPRASHSGRAHVAHVSNTEKTQQIGGDVPIFFEMVG